MSKAVLGGGISGLTAAYYLSKSAANQVRIYESSSRLGGWIRSVKSKNGALFEVGPRMLRYDADSSQETLKLLDELNLMSATKSLPRRDKTIKNKMLYVENKLVMVPGGFTSLFFVNPPIVKPFIYAIIRDYKTPKKVLEDESIHDFVARRFGEQYAEILIGSLVCGIFAGDAKDISVKAIWKELFEIEQEHGGVLRGLMPHIRKKKQMLRTKNWKQLNWALWSLENGLETLPTGLKKHLEQQENVDVFLRNECSRIAFRGGKAFLTINEEEKQVDHVYSSLPSKNLAKILGPEHSFLKTALSSIPFVSVAVVNLEYAGDVLRRQAMGCLVPPNQNLPVLGITFDSSVFPQEGKTVLTVMMGGKWFEQHFGPNPEEGKLLEIALDYVKKILKIEEKPVSSLVTVAKDCLPQYVVGHTKKVKEIREYIAKKKLPLTLIGASYDGVGVNDSIQSARRGVESTS